VTEDGELEEPVLTASAVGSIHAELEVPTGEADPEVDEPEPGQNDDPGPDVVGGAGKVVKGVLGALWDIIKPRE
jgi:hypothetical protein